MDDIEYKAFAGGPGGDLDDYEEWTYEERGETNCLKV